MMKPVLMLTVGMMLAGGCAMKEFSSSPLYSGSEEIFTGAVEDRVNLWPLAYWREPVGSVAWPMISWGKEHFALRPLYSQYKQKRKGEYDEFNVLWPVAQFDTLNDDYRFFPFFWGNLKKDDPYYALFPALWWNDEFAGVFPFFWPRGGGGGGFGIFPLFWSEWFAQGGFWHTLFPLYYYETYPKSDHSTPSDCSEFWTLCGLTGYERREGEFSHHRFLPFYLWDRGDFYSIPYSRYSSHRHIRNRILCGLAGYDANTNGIYETSWVFPFYYNDPKRTLVTLVYGRSKQDNAEWLVPFYYRDDKRFITPISGKTQHADWLFPLYYRDEYSCWSLLYGHSKDTVKTNRYFAAGLTGYRSGETEGGWIFPLFDKKTDADFAEKAAWIDAERLPEAITIKKDVTPAERLFGKTIDAPDFLLNDKQTYLLLVDNDRQFDGHIGWGTSTNRYKMNLSHERGNKLLFRYEGRRKVTFDVETRRKVRDEEKSETWLLGVLYQGNRTIDRIKGTSYACHNVLWKLWDWEQEDGNIALDVFPGFTYDAKTDGYRKVSLLWRLFRYENDPELGTAADLLFLPVWRSQARPAQE